MYYNNKMYSACTIFNFIIDGTSLIAKLAVGLGISVVIVSFYVKNASCRNFNNICNELSDDNSESDDDSDSDSSKIIKNYEEKYIEEYNNLDNNNLENDTDLSYIEDKTPKNSVPALFNTKAEAEQAAENFNCTGAHKMDDKWMPCKTHKAHGKHKQYNEHEHQHSH